MFLNIESHILDLINKLIFDVQNTIHNAALQEYLPLENAPMKSRQFYEFCDITNKVYVYCEQRFEYFYKIQIMGHNLNEISRGQFSDPDVYDENVTFKYRIFLLEMAFMKLQNFLDILIVELTDAALFYDFYVKNNYTACNSYRELQIKLRPQNIQLISLLRPIHDFVMCNTTLLDKIKVFLYKYNLINKFTNV